MPSGHGVFKASTRTCTGLWPLTLRVRMMVMKSAWVCAPVSLPFAKMFLLIKTAGRIDLSPPLLSDGTSLSSRNVSSSSRCRRYVLFCFLQPHSVHDQSVQTSIKLWPVAPGVVVMPGLVQISQQVWQALLLRKAGNGVVGIPEIGHQHTVEK